MRPTRDAWSRGGRPRITLSQWNINWLVRWSPDKFGWFRFVFTKQNNETFQTFTDSIRGKDLDQRVQLDVCGRRVERCSSCAGMRLPSRKPAHVGTE